MIKVVVGDRLKAKQGEDINTLPFVAKGTIETERTKGEVSVLVEAAEGDTVRLVAHKRHKSVLGPHQVAAYLSGAVAHLPRVAAPTEADKDATVSAELAPGLELVFADTVQINPIDAAPAPKEQEIF